MALTRVTIYFSDDDIEEKAMLEFIGEKKRSKIIKKIISNAMQEQTSNIIKVENKAKEMQKELDDLSDIDKNNNFLDM